VTIGNNKMADYSAGHISTKEAGELIEALNKNPRDNVRFYIGTGYRHIAVIKTRYHKELAEMKCVPPHDVLGEDITSHLPKGKHAQLLLSLMERSKKIFEEHPINHVRIDLKENPATMIWLWGQGTKPHIPPFREKFGMEGSVISAVDLVNGIGKLAGLDVIKVPGVTGYYDTNYLGKAQYALESLKKKDFVYVHVEATDEAGHNGDFKAKITCIERFDREIVGTVLNHFNKQDDFRILVSPDHATPVSKRTHTREPVCFVMHGKGIPVEGGQQFSEATAMEKGLKFTSGESMLAYFVRGYL
jgi:2,3-bisphosphoglycerate-independent phosphoglycerate mutase